MSTDLRMFFINPIYLKYIFISFFKTLCTVIVVIVVLMTWDFNFPLLQWEHFYDQSIKNEDIYSLCFVVISRIYVPRF